MLVTNELYRNQNYKLPLEPFFEDGLWLSALGARICCSSKHPYDLIHSDPRIVDVQARSEFLERLAKSKHYSVFAHSPAFYWLLGDSGDRLKQVLRNYKVFVYTYPEKKDEKEVTALCLTARHFFDGAGIPFDRKYVTADALEDALFYSLNPETGELVVGLDRKRVIAIVLPRKPWCWISFIFHDCSRVFTHQFVRHTYLNFSQCSCRFISVDSFTFPPTYSDKLVELSLKPFLVGIREWYSQVINRKLLLKEDARYFMPMATSSTIMASGPFFVWEDFASKRRVKAAQHEIREIAESVWIVLQDIKRKIG